MDQEKARKEEIRKLTEVSIAVAQKLYKSQKIRKSLQMELKQEKEKVFILSKQLNEAKENEMAIQIGNEKIGMFLDKISGNCYSVVLVFF